MKSIDVDELIHLIELNLNENTYALSKKIFIEMVESSKGEPVDVVDGDKVLIKMSFEIMSEAIIKVNFNPYNDPLYCGIYIYGSEPQIQYGDRRKDCINVLKQLKNGEQI